MTGYTKLFGTIVGSTIWREDNVTRIVWITMLALRNKNHVVEASLPGLADFARVSLEECQGALKKLMAADKYSRTKEHEGRRVQEVDGGWLILNAEKYRALMSSDERREYLRLKQREHRAKKKALSTNVNSVNNVKDKSTMSTQSEAETEYRVPSVPLSLKKSVPLSRLCPSDVKATKATKELKAGLSGGEKGVLTRIEKMLGSQWSNDAGKWVNRMKENGGKVERIVNELESALKEGRVTGTPAQCAEFLWKEFA